MNGYLYYTIGRICGQNEIEGVLICRIQEISSPC